MRLFPLTCCYQATSCSQTSGCWAWNYLCELIPACGRPMLCGSPPPAEVQLPVQDWGQKLIWTVHASVADVSRLCLCLSILYRLCSHSSSSFLSPRCKKWFISTQLLLILLWRLITLISLNQSWSTLPDKLTHSLVMISYGRWWFTLASSKREALLSIFTASLSRNTTMNESSRFSFLFLLWGDEFYPVKTDSAWATCTFSPNISGAHFSWRTVLAFLGTALVLFQFL